ncbi:MAG: polysaccharide deacetylase family protein [Planctomycetes bacterium]|nr:polysaccharide deacetylase family protein [Planctomycetota bacterium]
MAFTLDDLPVFPHMPLPDGDTPQSVAARIIDSLNRNGVSGVFALANSWPLDVDPGYARILDDWIAAGHHIGNHTHSHPLLNETSAEDFNHDISVADDLLAPWISKAPLRAFRHPLELWGNTEEKLVAVNAHLDRLAYRSAGVTSWFYEWEWDRAWRHVLQTGRTEEAERLKATFVDYAAAQVFARLFAEGVTFVPLSEALDDPAYLRSGTIVTDAFQVHQIKIAAADGRALDAVPPTHKALMERVFELGTPLRPSRRGMLVQNTRARATLPAKRPGYLVASHQQGATAHGLAVFKPEPSFS